MSYQVLNSEITIGALVFRGVHDVVVKRGIHGYVETAVIKVPHLARIVKGKRKSAESVGTETLFTDGDRVIVKLGYSGALKTEFEGFVRRCVLGMPMTVECEGYAYQLRLKAGLNKTYASTTVKDLLTDMCKGTDVTVECPVHIPLVGVKLLNANGTDVIEHIHELTKRTLAIFFISPRVLWCGLLYTPYLAGSKELKLPTVKYRPGFNILRDNELKQRLPKEPVQVFMNGVLVTGDGIRTASKDKTAARKVKHLLNNIPNADILQRFAQELALQMNYKGYDGFVNTYLVPFVGPGYVLQYDDRQFAGRNGDYLCESVETHFGGNGARRRVGVGPKIGGGNG